MNEKLMYLVKYSVRINSETIQDLLYDYLTVKTEECFVVPKEHTHKRLSKKSLLDLLKNNDKFANKIFLIDHPTHFIFFKPDINSILKNIDFK